MLAAERAGDLQAVANSVLAVANNPVEVVAPGRVNLIGEHTDYNEGFVMPAAIGYHTRARAVARAGRTVTIRSEGYGEPLHVDLDALPPQRTGGWADYARGVLFELDRAGVGLHGADVAITATIPAGAGLSSSASFEVALALAMLRVGGSTLDRLAIARLCQRAEVEHVGTRSGIMDQFAVLFAQPGCATFLDTRSLDHAFLPVPERAAVVIANTMVPHRLNAGAYNDRRAQCEAAVEILKRWLPGARSLRDVRAEDLEAHRNDLPEVVYRRARHVTSENERVLTARTALAAGNLVHFGLLMNASHASLRDDYEVSCPELDAMVSIARAQDGVYGARMTGGGFGGCTVNLVAAEAAEAFRAAVAQEYRRATGLVPQMYDGTPVAGAGVRG